MVTLANSHWENVLFELESERVNRIACSWTWLQPAIVGKTSKDFPFHSQEWSFSNFPCSPPEILYITQYKWKIIILPILTTSFIHFSLQSWENVLFELGNEGVNCLTKTIWAIIVSFWQINHHGGKTLSYSVGYYQFINCTKLYMQKG